jgi:hypothetical protein
MKSELINDSIGTRQKLILVLSSALAILLFVYFCGYYFAPIEYQTGIKRSRYWLSHTEFIGFSIITIMIIVPISAASKIIKKISINTDENKLEIEYIKRFKFNSITKKVKLSETIIQISKYEPRDRFYQKTGEIYYTLYLTNQGFGHLKISGQDFKKINEIANQFQLIKDDATIKIRKRRLNKKKRLPVKIVSN